MSLNAVDTLQQEQGTVASGPRCDSSANEFSVPAIVGDSEPVAPLELLSHADHIKVKVSSVLNRSAEFAGKNMFDGDLNSCWNSAAGSPQFILLDFGCLVEPVSLSFTFQGGFAGQECVVEGAAQLSELAPIMTLHRIEDTNDKQLFDFPVIPLDASVRYLKMTFSTSTDFYGRVTIYNCEVWGRKR